MRTGSGATLAASVAALLLLGASGARAQQASAGVEYAFAEYSEQGGSLHFAGSGVAGQASLGWGRFGQHLSAAALAFDPESGAGAADPFDLVQMDLRVRARVSRRVSVEAGYLQRDVRPLHAAQSVGAARVGAIVDFPLAPGSEVTVRTGYLGAAAFSGGGEAPFAIEVGLGASYAPWSGRVRVTGDLEFQRFDRSTSTPTGRLAAPIQSSTARIGVSIAR